MSTPEIFRVGNDRLLCDQWHARSRTVILRAQTSQSPIHADTVARVRDELSSCGVQRILTAALDEEQLEPFRSAGFVPHETLCVFRHDLETAPPSLAFRTRRGTRRRDLHRAAELDAKAFVASTPLDEAGLRGILAATPTCRFRLVEDDQGTSSGYILAGIAGMRGYLQRIAVDPVRSRRGLGSALVLDVIDWFQRQHVECALVNTQLDNVAAQHLYLATGFVPTSQRLAVWSWTKSAHR